MPSFVDLNGLQIFLDKCKEELPKVGIDIGNDSNAGLTKLYSDTGTSTDGTITQAALKDLLDSKLDSSTSDTYVEKISGKGLSSNDFTTADKTKLSNIETAAQVNLIESVKVNGSALPVTSKAVNIDLSGKLDSDATAASAFCDSSGNVITDTYITKADFARRMDAVRYGYRVRKDEPDPFERVEYIFDAQGMTPAHMVFEVTGDSDTGYFDYGSWAKVWFVRDNKPCMLKYDGTVDYYLDPNNYDLRESPLETVQEFTDTVVVDSDSGETDTVTYTDTVIITDTDVANSAYAGNAMAQFPLCWVKRYEDDDYYYEIVSNVQFDEDYHAYAHTKADGSIADFFYYSLFAASGSTSKLRSYSGSYPNGNSQASVSCSLNQLLSASKANGTGWYSGYWSAFQLIRTLMTLICKSTNAQSAFGYGNHRGQSQNSYYLKCGTLKDKGQFYGYNVNTKNVKAFHVEELWGNVQKRLIGTATYTYDDRVSVWVKMTPEGAGYKISSSSGYTKIADLYKPGVFYNSVYIGDFGLIPKPPSGGSSSTYFCDSFNPYGSSKLWAVIQVGGSINQDLACGGLHCVQTGGSNVSNTNTASYGEHLAFV